MLLGGHSASSLAKRLGISGANLLYCWRKQQVESAGPVGEVLDGRVAQIEAELRRVEREHDVMKITLIIFGRGEQPEPIGINELRVGDITYIPIVRNGFAYMATLMDHFSRRSIGWSLAIVMTEGLVIETLQKAIRSLQPDRLVIQLARREHSDR
jgi:transposase